MADSPDYLHGFDQVEQDRLIDQAEVLGGVVFADVTFEAARPGAACRILEVGCGVGAQTRQILDRFPGVLITAVDREPRQLARAGDFLRRDLDSGRVTLAAGDGAALPFPDGAFDAVFICWLLEHVTDPVAVLREAWRLLRPGGRLWCTEVYNSAVTSVPPMTATRDWWTAFTESQRRLGGDPDLGIRLGSLAARAGFGSPRLRPLMFHLDGRCRDAAWRQRFADYWRRLLLSGSDQMRRQGLLADGQAAAMAAEFEALARDPERIFCALAMQLSADKTVRPAVPFSGDSSFS